MDSKFTMLCDILKPVGAAVDGGVWTVVQDEAGDFVRTWVSDNPLTPNVNEASLVDVPCTVQGIYDGGIRVAGTTQRFSKVYENIDWARMNFPTNVSITKHDRVTNIRNKDGVLWREEEMDNSPATIFSVKGVIPTQGPYGRHSGNIALLERTEVQS